MKFSNTEVFNFEGAFRGLRNPLESWPKSDSYLDDGFFILGENDLDLAQRLIKGGTEHRKFLRQIIVSVDITAPLYFWKEFDTYKVGTVANSTSTMHRMAKSPITWDCFEFGDWINRGDVLEDCPEKACMVDVWERTIELLETLRKTYVETQDQFFWKELIRLLPSAWLQTRTVTMSYENLLAMYGQRKNHKLSEWHKYCDWVKTLPYTQAMFKI